MPTENKPLTGELGRAVERLTEVFAARSVRYALVGGLATLLRGRPRFTQDVDILLDVPQLALPGLLEHLAEQGFTFDRDTVILMKLVAFRPQDQEDIRVLLTANRDEIDLDLIRREWSAVAAGEFARTVWLEDAIAALATR